MSTTIAYRAMTHSSHNSFRVWSFFPSQSVEWEIQQKIPLTLHLNWAISLTNSKYRKTIVWPLPHSVQAAGGSDRCVECRPPLKLQYPSIFFYFQWKGSAAQCVLVNNVPKQKFRTIRGHVHSFLILRSQGYTYRGADKSLARPTSRCIFFLMVTIFLSMLVLLYIYIYTGCPRR